MSDVSFGDIPSKVGAFAHMPYTFELEPAATLATAEHGWFATVTDIIVYPL